MTMKILLKVMVIKMKPMKMIDYSVDVAGSSYGLVNVHTILGIIVLILTILNILIKMIIAIYHKIKSKQYTEIPNIIDNTIENFKELDKNEDN